MIILGIDSGTQSTKTIALDTETGAILAHAQEAYGLVPGLPPGHLEQNPAHWTKAVSNTIASVANELGARRKEIVAIGVSGQQHGLVVLDSKNEVIRPAKLWCDTSTVEECATLTRALGGPEETIKAVGNAMLPGFTAPKILWLKKNEPAAFEATRSILLPHDYINFWLTGEKRMEYGDASGTALLDITNRKWSRKAIQAIDPDLEAKLPDVRSSLAPIGLLRQNLKSEWGLSGEILVSAGGGDNMMGAIGTGNIAPGSFTVSLGTSGTIYAFSEKPVTDSGGEIAGFCDSTDNWLPLVCTMNVTVCTEQVRSLFNWDLDAFNNAVADAEPGAGGLIFLPYLNGERTPNLPEGCGVFHGLTTTTMTAPNMARSVVEGVSLGLEYGMRRFRELGLQPTEVRLTGGGSKSRVWRGILANIFGTPVVSLATAEGAALGAAIQAAHIRSATDGKSESLDSLVGRLVAVDESSRVEPDAALGELYKNLARRHTDLTRKLKAQGYL